MNVTVIGLGGIGSVLSNKLSRFLQYSSDEQVTLTLIDGDEYEDKNLERQEFDKIGNKAMVKAKEISKTFPAIEVEYIETFINSDTVKHNLYDGDIVFLCVDNHKTRKVVSDHCKTLDDVTLISGGNELTDGNIQIYIRKEGKDLTPDLSSYHPEIESPNDKSPDEMSCEELSNSDPQLFFTNAGVATFMCFAFWNSVINQNYEVSEVYFDMKLMAADPKKRIVKSPQQPRKEH